MKFGFIKSDYYSDAIKYPSTIHLIFKSEVASIESKSVKKLKAKGYFALRGTPIENSLKKL